VFDVSPNCLGELTVSDGLPDVVAHARLASAVGIILPVIADGQQRNCVRQCNKVAARVGRIYWQRWIVSSHDNILRRPMPGSPRRAR
jgi:hypothetical protein